MECVYEVRSRLANLEAGNAFLPFCCRNGSWNDREAMGSCLLCVFCGKGFGELVTGLGLNFLIWLGQSNRGVWTSETPLRF